MKHPITIGLVVLLILAVAACDQGASLQDAIARAITKTSEASSYRSAGNGTTYTDGGATVSSYELECAAPDHYHSVSTMNVDDTMNVTTTTAEIIVFGDKGYVRGPGLAQWQVCEVYTTDMRPTREPKSGTSCFLATVRLERELELFNYLVDLEKLPDEEIDGVNCSHYGGRVDQDSYLDMLIKRHEEAYAQLPPETLELMRRNEILVELCIDGDDYIRQHRIEFRFPTSQEEWVTGFSTTRYFDFNEPISIEPPEIE